MNTNISNNNLFSIAFIGRPSFASNHEAFLRNIIMDRISAIGVRVIYVQMSIKFQVIRGMFGFVSSRCTMHIAHPVYLSLIVAQIVCSLIAPAAESYFEQNISISWTRFDFIRLNVCSKMSARIYFLNRLRFSQLL